MGDLDVYLEQRVKLHTHMEEERVDEVIKWYDDFAQLYDAQIKHAGFKFHETVVDATLKFVPDKSDAILDLGAGNGILCEMLRKHGYLVIDALDASRGMLAVAKGKNIYRNIFCALIGTEPLKDLKKDSFDAIVSAGTFAHGAVYYESIPMLLSYLKTGGHLIFSISDLSMRICARLSRECFMSLTTEWRKKELCDIVSIMETFHINKEPATVFILRKL